MRSKMFPGRQKEPQRDPKGAPGTPKENKSVPPNSKAALPKKQKMPYLIIKLAHLIKLNPTSTDPYTTITKPPYLIIKLP